MEEEKISIVIPVYNVEKYLDKNINSVLNQTYKNLEIILVDDGSTDSSPVICDSFSKKDNRIIVIHKTNGGLSDARNVGTKIASGVFITFIDSDDWVEKDYVEYLYTLLKKYECNMSLCTHTVITERGKKKIFGNGTDEVLCAKECLQRMLYHDTIDTSAWGKMYQTDMAKEILYPKGMLFEDIGTTYRFFMKSKKIACGYQSKYNYMLRRNSIVSGRFNEKKLDLLNMTDKMAKDVLEVFPDLGEAVIRRRVYARFSTLNQMLDTDGYNEVKHQLIHFILKNKKKVLHNPRTPFRDKAAISMLEIGYPFYRLCWQILKKF